MDMAGIAPMFGTYKEGEIDFLVNSRETYKNYGVEVKAGKSERKITVPIYLIGRVNFDYQWSDKEQME